MECELHFVLHTSKVEFISLYLQNSVSLVVSSSVIIYFFCEMLGFGGRDCSGGRGGVVWGGDVHHHIFTMLVNISLRVEIIIVSISCF